MADPQPLIPLLPTSDWVWAQLEKGTRTVMGIYTDGSWFLSWDGFEILEEVRLQTLLNNHSGLTGTGWTDELRDMIGQLMIVASELDTEVFIPEVTRLAMAEEGRLNTLELSEGMVW